MDLLVFFAFPIATIIISIALQKILKCPILVAAIVFAIFLIVTFAAFDVEFLIATLAYTIISLVTAFIVGIICNNNDDDENNQNSCNGMNMANLFANTTNNNSCCRRR